MKANLFSITRRLLLAFASLLVASQLQAQFAITQGNLYIYQIGNGATNGFASGTAAAPVLIDQFSPTNSFASPTAQMALPTSGGIGVSFLASDNSGTEGSLALSPASDALTFMGYSGISLGAASVNNSSTVTNNRDVGVVSANGTFSIAATSTNFFSPNAGAGRGAVTDGKSNYWAVGIGTATGGTNGAALNYYGTNTAAAQVTAAASVRSIGIYGANLYYTAGSTMNTVPATNSPATPTTLFTDSDGLNGGTSQGFIFATNMTVCYIAEGSTVSGGGIRRFDYDTNSASWNYSYTLSGGTAFGFVTANFNGGGVGTNIIYATTLAVAGGGNLLDQIVDTGASSTTTLLATAPANENYNGIVFDSIAVSAPSVPLRLTSPAWISGAFKFFLTNTAGLNFKVYATTNLALANWTLLGVMTEGSAGQYQYSDVQATNSAHQFYQVRWP